MECAVKIELRVYYSSRCSTKMSFCEVRGTSEVSENRSSFCCQGHCQLCNECLRDAHTHPLHWNSEFFCVPSLYIHTYVGLTACECDVYAQLSLSTSIELRWHLNRLLALQANSNLALVSPMASGIDHIYTGDPRLLS